MTYVDVLTYIDVLTYTKNKCIKTYKTFCGRDERILNKRPIHVRKVNQFPGPTKRVMGFLSYTRTYILTISSFGAVLWTGSPRAKVTHRGDNYHLRYALLNLGVRLWKTDTVTIDRLMYQYPSHLRVKHTHLYDYRPRLRGKWLCRGDTYLLSLYLVSISYMTDFL